MVSNSDFLTPSLIVKCCSECNIVDDYISCTDLKVDKLQYNLLHGLIITNLLLLGTRPYVIVDPVDFNNLYCMCRFGAHE